MPDLEQVCARSGADWWQIWTTSVPDLNKLVPDLAKICNRYKIVVKAKNLGLRIEMKSFGLNLEIQRCTFLKLFKF